MSYNILKWVFILMVVSFVIKGGLVMADEIRLPQPVISGEVSLEEAIAKRRSQRSFSDESLSLNQISQLLWAAQGVTERNGEYSFRTVPSAGAAYPMQIYAVTKDRVYHYIPESHTLEVVAEGDRRPDLSAASLSQDSVKEAAIDIVICGVYEKVTSMYGKRGRRYVEIEAGHIAQNIHLQAVALGLGSVPVGAFLDPQVQSVLNLPEEEIPLYIIPVGHAQ